MDTQQLAWAAGVFDGERFGEHLHSNVLML